MIVDYCSDLHVDAWETTTQLVGPTVRRWMGEPYLSTFIHLDWRVYKTPGARVLIIAGDISNNIQTSVAVIEAAAAEYEYVVVVDGNHDHYDNDMAVERGMKYLTEQLVPFPNVYFLSNECGLLLDGVAFLGACGWYDWKAYESQGISDYQAKRTWNQYNNDSNYASFECSGPDSMAMTQAINMAAQVRHANQDDAITDVVAVTHMSPRADIMEWKADDRIWNALTPSYVNTAMSSVLAENTQGKLKNWVYGHTHTRQEIEIDDVMYRNNARGYPRENKPFTLTSFEVGAK